MKSTEFFRQLKSIAFDIAKIAKHKITNKDSIALANEMQDNTNIFLDSHPTGELKAPIDQIYGWVKLKNNYSSFSLFCEEYQLPLARIKRPDLEKIAEVEFLSFSTFINLSKFSNYMESAPDKIKFAVYGDGKKIAEKELFVNSNVWHGCAQLVKNKIEKKRFIESAIRAPLKTIEGCDAPSALPDNWSISPDLEDKTDLVSSHNYSGPLREFLESFPSDAFVLDAGAGMKRWPRRNVVTTEIYDYPSTDVLSIGQELPFRDSVFDGVVSMAVLEHVSDPFVCAQELIRVTKPGGKIFVSVPFLQAEHGYPSHYFNPTRFGVRELFARGTSLNEQYLEASNHPIFTLNQILSVYASGLPNHVMERFLDQSVEFFLQNAPEKLYNDKHEFVSTLDKEVAWQVAWGTTSVFEKN